MRKAILHSVKATFLITASFISTLWLQQANAQQHIIANKDNTRPESNRPVVAQPLVPVFTAQKFNGYNEINWRALADQGTRRFVVEYSWDGVDFLSAGTALSINGLYTLKHYTPDLRPMLYRVRMEDLSGKYIYSSPVMLDGLEVQPVKIYPTIVTGSELNANAGFPVERVAIVSNDGQQVFAKDLNGVRDFIPLALPTLNKGLYFITFYGNGWKSTSRFVVG
jgi:hypothetical protein